MESKNTCWCLHCKIVSKPLTWWCYWIFFQPDRRSNRQHSIRLITILTRSQSDESAAWVQCAYFHLPDPWYTACTHIFWHGGSILTFHFMPLLFLCMVCMLFIVICTTWSSSSPSPLLPAQLRNKSMHFTSGFTGQEAWKDLIYSNDRHDLDSLGLISSKKIHWLR